MKAVNKKKVHLGDWVIRSKITPPSISFPILKRTLNCRFNESKQQPHLTLVCATAGYGKSILLTQLHAELIEQGSLAAWISIDKDDKDPVHLLAYLIASIASTGIDMTGLDTQFKTGFMQVRSDTVINTLIKNFEKVSTSLTIFIDDYHRAQSDNIDRFLNMLIDKSPENIHFIIATRSKPSMETVKLRAAGLFKEISNDDLKFSITDARAIFNDEVSEQEIGKIIEFTEGWPVAIRLVQLWLDEKSATKIQFNRADIRNTDLPDYLTEQIIHGFPEEFQQRLLQTSILDRFNGDIINALSEKQDGWYFTEYLQKRNLLISLFDENCEWYRHHHVFKSYLNEQLQRYNKSSIPRLHRHAAIWFFDNGYFVESIKHAVNADDPLFLTDLLDKAGGWSLIIQGGMAALQAFNLLSEEFLSQFPKFKLGKIYLMLHKRQIQQARFEFDSIVDGLTKQKSIKDEDNSIIAEIKLFDELIHVYEDKHINIEELISLKEELSHSFESNAILIALIHELLCGAYFGIAKYQESISEGKKCIYLCQKLDAIYLEAYTYLCLGLSSFEIGELTEAQHFYQLALTKSNEEFGENNSQALMAKILLAETLYEYSYISDASDLLDQSLSEIDNIDLWFDLYARAFRTKFMICSVTANTKKQLDLIAQSELIAKQLNNKRLKVLILLLKCRECIKTSQYEEAQLLINNPIITNSQETLNYYDLEKETSLVIARLDLANGNNKEVLSHLLALEASLDRDQEIKLVIQILNLKSIAYFHLGKNQQSLESLKESLKIIMSKGFKRTLIDEGGLIGDVLALAIKQGKLFSDSEQRFIKELSTSITHEIMGADDDQNKKALTKLRDSLSNREIDVLKLLAIGYTSKEMSWELKVAESTIITHRKNLYAKLGTTGRSRAISLGVDMGLLTQP